MFNIPKLDEETIDTLTFVPIGIFTPSAIMMIATRGTIPLDFIFASALALIYLLFGSPAVGALIHPLL